MSLLLLLSSSLSTNNSNNNSGDEEKKKKKKKEFCINDHRDVLVEIMKRLDGRSLGVAACVCKLWCDLATYDDSIWEHVCFRHVSPPRVRSLVVALGGYKRLYMVCVRPVLGRLGNRAGSRKRARWAAEAGELMTRRVWTRQGAQLLLSLFCVDYYEKLGGGNGISRGVNDNAAMSPPSSLMFLCKPVNV